MTTFTKANTAVYLSGTDNEQVAFFGGQKYIFEVDNKNIFALKKGADPAGYASGDRTVLTGLESFKNKNIIMPSGDYGTIYFYIPANYYGANFGINPVDKSGACAENNYDWALNTKWGSTGETKLNTTNISRAVTEGNIVFDGFTLNHRFYDDHRNTRTGDVNIKFVNHVVNTNSTSASTSAGRTYNLNNALTQNANDADLGRVYNDSFTLENTFVLNTGINRDFMNEFVCANVILDNVYLDNTAALKSRSAMGYAKLGGANLKHNYIVKNSNFRNGVGAGNLFQSNLYQTASINDVPATYDTNAVFTNNIFYNATTGAGAIFSTHQLGYFTSITFDDNKVINTNNPTGYIITWDQNNTNSETAQLKGNFSFNNNTITGYAADKYIKPVSEWGTDAPAATSVDGHKYDDGVVSGEANSLASVEITANQVELAREAHSSGKKVVGVIFGGRPLALDPIEPYLDAILYAWHSGTETAHAACDILFGDVNPSGKSSVTFVKTTGHIPLYYNQLHPAKKINAYYGAENIMKSVMGSTGYLDIPSSPMYPFGYGLSYTTFEISSPSAKETEISSEDLKAGKCFEISVKVKNSGSRKGKETVQLYIHDLFATYIRPEKELKGFEKIELEAGEEKEVTLTLGYDELGFYDERGKYLLERGDFDVFVGDDCFTKNKMRIRII